MAKVITTLCLVFSILSGGAGGDPKLLRAAQTAFLTITQAEELALNQYVEPAEKKRILLNALGQVATEPLLSKYEAAWENQRLGLTLTVEKFSRVKVVQTNGLQALVLVQVVGKVNDESGSAPVCLNYLLIMHKEDGNWLLSDIH